MDASKDNLKKTILVTRPREQASELQKSLEELGFRVALQPAAQILPPDDPAPLDAALDALERAEFDWLLFSSANGVRFTLRRLCERFSLAPEDAGAFLETRRVKTAVVGSGTAKALAPYAIAPAVVPERFDAEGLIAALDKAVAAYPSRRFLSMRASRGRQVLAAALSERGAKLHEVVAYQSVDVVEPDPDVLAELRRGAIDAAVVTSSASAKALAALFGEDARKTRWIALSPLTAAAMEERGVRVEKIAEEATMESLVLAVRAALSED